MEIDGEAKDVWHPGESPHPSIGYMIDVHPDVQQFAVWKKTH